MAHTIIEEIGQILPPSRNLAETLARAESYASLQSHPEVTLEHLLLALTEDPDAALVLALSEVDVTPLKGDVSSHLGRLEDRTGIGGAVGISNDLRQILEAAAAAARGRRDEIDGAIVLAAIVGDGSSTAAHLLRAHGLTFETAIRALQQAAEAAEYEAEPAPEPPEAPAPAADPMPPPPDDMAPPAGPLDPRGPIRHPQLTNAEDILASARQRVHGRITPGLGDVPEDDPPPTLADAPADAHAPRRTVTPEDLKAAEDATDAEFDRIATELAEAESETGSPVAAGRVAEGHEADEDGQAPRDDDRTIRTIFPPSAATAGEPKPGDTTIANAPRPDRDGAAAGPGPAPPARRPSPPGAIRPQPAGPTVAGEQAGAAEPGTHDARREDEVLFSLRHAKPGGSAEETQPAPDLDQGAHPAPEHSTARPPVPSNAVQPHDTARRPMARAPWPEGQAPEHLGATPSGNRAGSAPSHSAPPPMGGMPAQSTAPPPPGPPRPAGPGPASPAPPHATSPSPGVPGQAPGAATRDVFGPRPAAPQPGSSANAARPQQPPPPPPGRFPPGPPIPGLPGMAPPRPPGTAGVAGPRGPAGAAAPPPPTTGRAQPPFAPPATAPGAPPTSPLPAGSAPSRASPPPHAPGPQRSPPPQAGLPGPAMPFPAPAASPPMTPAAAAARARSAEVALGQMVENIPRSMRVGIPSIIEVRIARAEVKALADGLQGGGAVWRHDLTVTKAMSVRLRAPDGGFFIETASPETQWIENTLGLITDDHASWRWTVTPRERGTRRLQLVISARTVGTDGLAAETALPDQIVDVKVRINYSATARRAGGWALAAIAGGVLARFGEDLPAAIGKLIGSIVK